MTKKNKKYKVFIGFSNTAGNSSIFVKFLRLLGFEAKLYYASKHKFGYEEENLGRKIYFSKYGKINRVLYVFYSIYFIIKYDIFIFSGYGTLLPSHLDLKIIRKLNKKIIFQFTGCDARDYRWFLNEYDYKYNLCKMCTDEYKDYVKCRIDLKINIVKLAEKYGNLIIAHPHYKHLFSKKYEYFWVPVDTKLPDNYISQFTLDETKPLHIIHAPSHIDVKGTKYIEDAINRLVSDGYKIKYERIQDVTNDVVIEKIMECDIAIDQLYALHGLFGVEAMNYSKPMICYIDKFFLDELPKDLPFIDANPETLYDVLKNLYHNRGELERLGNKSREYVLEHHDATKVIKHWMDLVLENEK